MAEAPIVVHRLSRTGSRRVTARGRILGLAHSDLVRVVFLEAAGPELDAAVRADGGGRGGSDGPGSGEERAVNVLAPETRRAHPGPEKD
ncbi:hypothetical protein [Streptomyces sp. NPDC057909]|uniref:hypothetical protein n=1 Tax=Streptomyces sp. NPDC057909 TaxID=3346277 RepID=UPI0036E65AFE